MNIDKISYSWLLKITNLLYILNWTHEAILSDFLLCEILLIIWKMSVYKYTQLIFNMKTLLSKRVWFTSLPLHLILNLYWIETALTKAVVLKVQLVLRPSASALSGNLLNMPGLGLQPTTTEPQAGGGAQQSVWTSIPYSDALTFENCCSRDSY